MLLSVALSLLLSGNLLEGSYGCIAEAAQKPRPRKSRVKAKKVPSVPSPADIAVRREAIHKLMLNGEYQHDGAGELLGIGDISSVPALLRVLKDNPPIRKTDGRITYICTTAHALSALRKITGINGGATYEEWNVWWEQNKKYYEK